MQQHLAPLLDLLYHCVSAPLFVTDDLELFRQRQVQRLYTELEKNDVLAYRTLTEAIFGSKHPYGYNSTPAMYEALRPEQLLQHHAQCYHPSHSFAVIAGGWLPEHLALLDQTVGRWSTPACVQLDRVHRLEPQPSRNIRVQRTQTTLQAAIRLGCAIGHRLHPDYPGLYVLNTILGGYFGSRLMTNLRERNGYTYGVDSSLDIARHNGYWQIATEVSTQYLEAAIEQIYHEMELLRTQPVAPDELDMVRSYLLGNLLYQIDGVFNTSELYRDLLYHGYPPRLIAQLTDTIVHITPEQLLLLAQRYLQPERWYQVVVY